MKKHLVIVGLGIAAAFAYAVSKSDTAAVAPHSTNALATIVGTRATADRPDDQLRAKQIHVVYVVPREGTDRQFDTNGSIATSVAAFQNWLKVQTGTKRLRMDTYQGVLDITFVQLSRSDAELQTEATAMGSPLYLRDILEREIKNLGFTSSNKIYALYYEGGSTTPACGGAFWPPVLPGSVVAQYLLGTPPGAPACSTNTFTTSDTSLGYWEVSMIHEILHGLGAVSTCALHHTLSGHVSDSAQDLMYAGTSPWLPSGYNNAILDTGRDDYYGLPKKKACPSQVDVAKSAFLEVVN